MAYHEQPWTVPVSQIEQLGLICAAIDLNPGPGGSRITPLDATLIAECQAVLGPVLLGWVKAQGVVLYPSAQLVAHRDPPIAGRRYHLPLVVNAGCWVFHAGTWQQLEVGKGYEMDPTEEHGAVNWGATRRLHLIIDTES